MKSNSNFIIWWFSHFNNVQQSAVTFFIECGSHTDVNALSNIVLTELMIMKNNYISVQLPEAPYLAIILPNLAMEVCPPKQRSTVGVLLALPYAVMMVILAVLAYYIRDWRTLQLACSIPTLLLFPLTLWVTSII